MKGQMLHHGKVLGGKGILTETTGKIQNYYGMAIRRNLNSAICEAIYAVLADGWHFIIILF